MNHEDDPYWGSLWEDNFNPFKRLSKMWELYTDKKINKVFIDSYENFPNRKPVYFELTKGLVTKKIDRNPKVQPK